MNILSKGKYGGVGIQLSYRNEQMIVIAPMDGGPAQTAGILSGDIILKVDDAFVKDMSFNDAA
ncbi:MAG: PDZ domain-containing protein, partial [Candidatus Neomarinimicrobiota bacterium]|nr:PDZ domain-containing protein [Candidatus Neomarinimicrobiota bacterium]